MSVEVKSPSIENLTSVLFWHQGWLSFADYSAGGPESVVFKSREYMDTEKGMPQFPEDHFPKREQVKYLVVQTKRHCLVPEHFTNVADPIQLTEFAFTLDNEELLGSQLLHTIGCRMYYPIDKTLKGNQEGRLNESFEISHIKPPAIAHFDKLIREPNESCVWLNLNSGWIEICVWVGKNLVMCNSYNCKHVESVLYYVLLNYFNFNLRPGTDRLYVSGKISEDSIAYQQLSKYIKHILFASPRCNQELVPMIGIPIHEHFEQLAFLHEKFDL